MQWISDQNMDISIVLHLEIDIINISIHGDQIGKLNMNNNFN